MATYQETQNTKRNLRLMGLLIANPLELKDEELNDVVLFLATIWNELIKSYIRIDLKTPEEFKQIIDTRLTKESKEKILKRYEGLIERTLFPN